MIVLILCGLHTPSNVLLIILMLSLIIVHKVIYHNPVYSDAFFTMNTCHSKLLTTVLALIIRTF